MFVYGENDTPVRGFGYVLYQVGKAPSLADTGVHVQGGVLHHACTYTVHYMSNTS